MKTSICTEVRLVGLGEATRDEDSPRVEIDLHDAVLDHGSARPLSSSRTSFAGAEVTSRTRPSARPPRRRRVRRAGRRSTRVPFRAAAAARGGLRAGRRAAQGGRAVRPGAPRRASLLDDRRLPPSSSVAPTANCSGASLASSTTKAPSCASKAADATDHDVLSRQSRAARDGPRDAARSELTVCNARAMRPAQADDLADVVGRHVQPDDMSSIPCSTRTCIRVVHELSCEERDEPVNRCSWP